MNWWIDLAPWEFEISAAGSRISTILDINMRQVVWRSLEPHSVADFLHARKNVRTALLVPAFQRADLAETHVGVSEFALRSLRPHRPA